MQRVPPQKLLDVTTALLEAFGMDTPEAESVAASLVSSEIRGHNSHGVIRLSTLYRAMIESGSIDPTATPTVERHSPSVISVDGNRAFGQLTGDYIVDAGVEAAEEAGISVVGVRGGAHLGRVGEWAERAAEEGFATFGFINSGGTSRTVTVPGSADRIFATNPITVGVPTFDELEFPIVLDMATSQVAHGKITKLAVDEGTIPEAWTVTETGEHVEDAVTFEETNTGAILPLGGQASGRKGYGLALCAELFAGIIGRGEVVGDDENEYVNNAGMFVFVDPLRFSSQGEIETVIRTVHDQVRNAEYPDAVETGYATKGDRALMPGEPEHRTRLEYEAEGIPLTDGAIDALTRLAEERGVETPLF
jgi:uncharacterized oxidoreductase